MKWYEVLVEDEFVNYFYDDSNIFTVSVDGKEKLAPIFERYRQIVRGVAYGYAIHLFERQYTDHYENMDPDFYKGYIACSGLKYGKKETIGELYWSARQKENEGINLNSLRPEEIASLLMYPFFTRMGGSFEISFQKNGNLKEHITALRAKVDQEI